MCRILNRVTQEFQRQRYALGCVAVSLLFRQFGRQREDGYDYDIVFAVSPGLGECKMRRYEALAGDGKLNQALSSDLDRWGWSDWVLAHGRDCSCASLWFWSYRVWRSMPDPDASGLSPKTVCGRRRDELHLLFIAPRQANTKADVHSATAVTACSWEGGTQRDLAGSDSSVTRGS
jgi:hypothetical protein